MCLIRSGRCTRRIGTPPAANGPGGFSFCSAAQAQLAKEPQQRLQEMKRSSLAVEIWRLSLGLMTYLDSRNAVADGDTHYQIPLLASGFEAPEVLQVFQEGLNFLAEN